ncbi:Na(+)/H(+) antiporter subunit C [Exiguobacterium sp. SH3S2]|uniref:Na(+)/H(+) antiporter subunit C n=1 Tax=unclassified Exiguobacterium TaxID=2644629 RepID=UPI0008B2CD7D|nr:MULTISPECIES: Na(+)/H(+) antiporter subunit C [unclassified Exiguobacterium]OGX78237.1 Na(+)/H(+) antiporter subunit C [Exiguobacterium sp. SH31]TCI26413.1 Na(+)/H(+) antiporter subunit C [Exiguobacterium sp. SH5S4]TCI37616.1 Na(+)/H(+) antiporter subunit C [Exiguobacterium sp. SH4S7]TCI43378.1 Na(+)/H(+) antiporter subunit C [Exiguobacterium sp. SH3S3]TCI45949.1 Na(+)/H(+) antiporter subunit C [Exiguobacterium sp. SH5S32]
MEIFVSIIIGVLTMSAVYMILSKSLLRIIIGTGLLSHAAHLLVLTMGGLKTGAAPVLVDGVTEYTDPLPQALVLTAIVISFGVTAFFLVLAYRTYQELTTDNIEEMKGTESND